MDSRFSHSQVKGLPYNERSVSVLNDETVRLVAEHGITPVWAFLRLTRAYYTMDASVRELMPDTDPHEVIREYIREKQQRAQQQLDKAFRPDLTRISSLLPDALHQALHAA